MGSWGKGPFDNDSAADWCGNLHDADPARRVRMIRGVLRTVVVDTGAAAYLDLDDAQHAIAAAAIIASQRPGGPAVTSAYAPEFLTTGGTVAVPDDLVELAERALARVVGDQSEWRDVWADAGTLDEVVAELQPIRAALAQR